MQATGLRQRAIWEVSKRGGRGMAWRAAGYVTSSASAADPQPPRCMSIAGDHGRQRRLRSSSTPIWRHLSIHQPDEVFITAP